MFVVALEQFLVVVQYLSLEEVSVEEMKIWVDGAFAYEDSCVAAIFFRVVGIELGRRT